MQSSNPVFRRSEGFNGKSTTSGMSYPAYGTQTQTDPYRQDAPIYAGPSTEARMTIDSVVQKTGMTLGLTILVAVATWVLTPDPGTGADAGSLYLLLMVGAFGGFALSMVNSFKRVISPGLVLVYAALEGLFVGAFSKVIDASFGGPDGGGLIIGAVAGTFAAVAGTLAAYKFFNIRVSPTFRKWVVGAMLGFVAVALLDVVLGFFGSVVRLQRLRRDGPACPASSAWASAC